MVNRAVQKFIKRRSFTSLDLKVVEQEPLKLVHGAVERCLVVFVEQKSVTADHIVQAAKLLKFLGVHVVGGLEDLQLKVNVVVVVVFLKDFRNF